MTLGTNRDTDFTNLQPGDEITVIWTVQSDGRASSRSDGSVRLAITHVIADYNSASPRTAFVSKRQPRPSFKAGDTVQSKYRSSSSWSKTKILFIDEKSLYLEFVEDGSRGHRLLADMDLQHAS